MAGKFVVRERNTAPSNSAVGGIPSHVCEEPGGKAQETQSTKGRGACPLRREEGAGQKLGLGSCLEHFFDCSDFSSVFDGP